MLTLFQLQPTNNQDHTVSIIELILIAKTSSALRSRRGSVRRASTTDVGISEGKELFCVTYVIQNVRPVGSSPDVRLSMSVDRRVGSVNLQRKGFLLQQTVK